MNRRLAIALAATALVATASAAALAQNAPATPPANAPSAAAPSSPPSYQADPSVYKVIFENDQFRVISAAWKAGQTDKPHSHPVPAVIYFVSNCTLKLVNPDGTTRDVNNKAGQSMAVPMTASHTAHNVGHSACHAVFVELKK